MGSMDSVGEDGGSMDSVGEDWSSVSNSDTTVTDERGGVDSVGEDRSVDGVGEDRGSMDSVGEDGGSMDSVGEDRGSMGNSYGSRSINGGARVADVLGDTITIVNIVDSLDPAVRKVDSVAARGGKSVPLLALGEGSSAVVVSDSVVVGVHWGLREVLSSCHYE